MNRRTLLGMVLGALAGGSVTNIAWAAVERNLTPAAPPLAPSVRTPSVSIAELFVSCDQDVSAAVAGLTALGEQVAPVELRLGHFREQRWIGYPQAGSLIISNEAEAKVFIHDLAKVVANSRALTQL